MTTFSASRIWSLVGMAHIIAGRVYAAAERDAAAEHRGRGATARERLGARRPSVAAISASPTPWASIPRIARSSGARRAPTARSARGSSGARCPPRRASSSARGGADFGSTASAPAIAASTASVVVGERRVDDHARRLGQRARAQAQREAVVVGQVQVDQRDGGARVGDRLEALARRRRRRRDPQVVLVVDQPAQPGADRGVVVDDDEVHPRDCRAAAAAPPSGDAPYLTRARPARAGSRSGRARRGRASRAWRGCSCGGARRSSR